MIRSVLLVAVLAVAAAGCGRGGDSGAVATRPAEVPLELVPATLAAATLSIAEDESSTAAFAEAGEEALITDGRLWAIRKGDTLVATLQISTVKPDVDLTEASDRDAISTSILPGASEEIEVEGVPVLSAEANDKTVYVWFASDLFEVLQIKSTDLEPEALLAEIIRYQTARDGWVPLPDDDLVDDDEVLE